MGSETVVLDSSNLEAIIADVTGEPIKAPEPKTEAVQPKDAKASPVPSKAAEEDENGLTEEQRKILTKTMQGAVGKKHRMWREAEERLQREAADRRRADERAEAAERELAQLREASKPKVEPAKKPERANFATDDEYHDALVEFRVKEQLAKEREQQQKEREEQRQREVIENAAKRISHAREIVPDWPTADEIEAIGEEVRIPPTVAGYLQESELIAELTYHFYKNPEELARLGDLTPARQLVEIGKIESKLSPFSAAKPEKVEPRTVAKTEPNGDKPSQAKPSTTDASPSRPRESAPVIRPLTTRGAPQVEKPESEMDAVEARKAWEKRNGAQLGRRQRH